MVSSNRGLYLVRATSLAPASIQNSRRIIAGTPSLLTWCVQSFAKMLRTSMRKRVQRRSLGDAVKRAVSSFIHCCRVAFQLLTSTGPLLLGLRADSRGSPSGRAGDPAATCTPPAAAAAPPAAGARSDVKPAVALPFPVPGRRGVERAIAEMSSMSNDPCSCIPVRVKPQREPGPPPPPPPPAPPPDARPRSRAVNGRTSRRTPPGAG